MQASFGTDGASTTPLGTPTGSPRATPEPFGDASTSAGPTPPGPGAAPAGAEPPADTRMQEAWQQVPGFGPCLTLDAQAALWV